MDPRYIQGEAGVEAPDPLAALRAKVAQAREELYRTQMGNDLAYSDGSYARARQVVDEAEAELKEAENGRG